MTVTGDETRVLEAQADQWTVASFGALSFDPSRMPAVDVGSVHGSLDAHAAVSPDCSYRLVKAALDSAREEILLYIYNLSAEHLLQLLTDARQRGVGLRIMYDSHDTRGDERARIETLRSNGAQVKVAPSSGGRSVFTVCHQKFAVIDRSSVLIGSANWAGSSIPFVVAGGDFKKGNREWLMHLRGSTIAERFGALFEADWAIPEVPALVAPAAEAVSVPASLVPSMIAPPERVFDLADFEIGADVEVTPLVSPDNYRAVMVPLVARAKQSVDIQQQYIQLGGPATESLLETLRDLPHTVQIRIMVSPAFRRAGETDSWELTVETLTHFGLASSLRAMNLGSYTHCHNKGLIVDRRWTVVSSTNWSENSIVRAREAGVLIDSPQVAAYFGAVFDWDWSIGIDAADLPAQLAALEPVAMGPDVIEIHPADLH
jgi:phosphatidylserine/phosphatidylglycerophosphate/cardiolipin synthase-like enzyme